MPRQGTDLSACLDRYDCHQILHDVGELPVECDQRVGVELGQGDVLGIKGVWPPEQACGLPGDILQYAEPVRIDPDPAPAAPPGDHLVDAVGSHRRSVVHPQLRSVRLPVSGADPDVAVKTAGSLMAEPDDPRLAALAADGDLALP